MSGMERTRAPRKHHIAKVIAVDAHRIAYNAVPKAGCSSVKAALAQIDPDVTMPAPKDISVFTWHRLYPTVRFRSSSWARLNMYWRFCVVRDPARRLMSVYTNRVLEMDDLKNSRKLGLPKYAHLTREPDPDFFFQNLPDYIAASSAIKHHAMSARMFLGPRPMRYDRVYKTEEMAQLAADLSERTGQEVVMARKNSSETHLDVRDLKYRTVQAIKPFLKGEYRYLRDYYENPL